MLEDSISSKHCVRDRTISSSNKYGERIKDILVDFENADHFVRKKRILGNLEDMLPKSKVCRITSNVCLKALLALSL